MTRDSKLTDWVGQQQDRQRAQACVEFARFMNRRRESIADLLSEDCVYDPQHNVSNFHGRRVTANHHEQIVGGEVRLIAELAREPLDGEPCVVMVWVDRPIGRQDLTHLHSCQRVAVDEDGLINSLIVTRFAPSPYDCHRSEIYPGLEAAELQQHLERTGPLLSRFGMVTLLVSLRSQDDAEYAERVAEVVRELRLPSVDSEVCDPEDPRLADPSAGLLPSLSILREERCVRRIDGALSREELVRVLSSLFDPLPKLAFELTDQRPDYFAPPASEERAVLRRIKGTYRRELVEHGLESDTLDEIPDVWLTHDLDEKFRLFLNGQNPAWRGGEDLVDLLPDEVEIARRELQSIHGEVVSLRARPRKGGGIRLRMVGETFDHDEVCELSYSEADHSLDALEVLELFRDAQPSALEHDCPQCLRSEFYPELGRLLWELGFRPRAFED